MLGSEFPSCGSVENYTNTQAPRESRKIDSRVHHHPLNVYALRLVKYFPFSLLSRPLRHSLSVDVRLLPRLVIATKCWANKRFAGRKANKFILIVEPLDCTTFLLPRYMLVDLCFRLFYQRYSRSFFFCFIITTIPIERRLIYVPWKLFWWIVNGERLINQTKNARWLITNEWSPLDLLIAFFSSAVSAVSFNGQILSYSQSAVSTISQILSRLQHNYGTAAVCEHVFEWGHLTVITIDLF